MMPPVLKVLSLITTILCVVLLFGFFSINDHIEYKNHYPKITFKPSRKHVPISTATSSLVATGSTTDTVSSLNSVEVVQLSLGGTYLDYQSTSTLGIDFNSLERLGGDYYKGKDAVYFRLDPADTCGDTVKAKLVKLESLKPSAMSDAQRGNFVTDGKDVFLSFFHLVGAHPETFSYVGIARDEVVDTDKATTYWYKDKNKVYSLVSKMDPCKGFSFLEASSGAFSEADALSFEYISGDKGAAYAKDKSYFYDNSGRLSDTVTPQNCKGAFLDECLPKIKNTTSASSTIMQ